MRICQRTDDQKRDRHGMQLRRMHELKGRETLIMIKKEQQMRETMKSSLLLMAHHL